MVVNIKSDLLIFAIAVYTEYALIIFFLNSNNNNIFFSILEIYFLLYETRLMILKHIFKKCKNIQSGVSELYDGWSI